MNKQNNSNLISLFFIVLAAVIALVPYITKNLKLSQTNKVNISQSAAQNSEKQNKNDNKARKRNFPFGYSDEINVSVNYPVSLSYKSKKDILALRKLYVEDSIFASPDYEPSEIVFGQIVSGKPWNSVNFCEDKKAKASIITGPSEESRFINNPTMLVALEYPYRFGEDPADYFCNSPENQLIPVKISYSKSKNEIIVKYSKLPFDASTSYFYQFNGVNAHDFGYKYAYVDLSRSSLNFKFSYRANNMSTDVQQFRNFIHLGSSCGHVGGCNNGSPRQIFSEFNYKKGNGGGEIYIKLWKERPYDKNAPADITERIIIEG